MKKALDKAIKEVYTTSHQIQKAWAGERIGPQILLKD